MLTPLSHELSVDHDVYTPENVSFHYEVAGIGSRFIGALVDTLLVALLMFAVNALVVGLLLLIGGPTADSTSSAAGDETAVDWVAGLILAAYVFMQFAIVWGYFSLFEALWHGQTPGKHLAGTRVVRRDGSPVRPLDVVIRNLVRIVDFMPFGYGLGFLVMAANRQSRRLGDFAAGTLVVHEREAVGLKDLGGPAGPGAGRTSYMASSGPPPAANSLPAGAPAYLPASVPPLVAGLGPTEAGPEPPSAGIGTPDAGLGSPGAEPGRFVHAHPDPELERLRLSYPLFRRLSPADLALLGDTLARDATQAVAADIPQRLAGVLAAKMELPPPSPAVTRAFLADLWRLAQRADEPSE